MSSYRKLLVFLGPYRGRFLGALAAMAIFSACTGAAALLVKNVLDDIFIARDGEKLRLVPLLVIAVYLIKGAASYLHTYLMKYIGQSIIRDLRNAIYDHLLAMPLSFFTSRSTGSLMSRVMNDVALVQFAVTNTLTSVIRDPLSVVALAAVLFYRSWLLALIALVAFPLAIYPLVRFGRSFRRTTRKSQDKVSAMTTQLHETIGGIKIVKAFGREDDERRRFRAENDRFLQLSLKNRRIEAMSPPLMESLGAVGVALVVMLGGSQVISGRLSTGEFFSFMTALLMLYEPLKRLTTVNNATQEALGAADRIFEVLDVESDIIERPGAVPLPRTPGSVVFNHVSFGYGDREVLSDVSLAVAPGEVVAFVGSSGVGKSTLVSLVPRFYDVTGGSITIDGYDVRDVTVRSLRSRIALVTQETVLFNDTVRANIAYGRPEASLEEVGQAARAAFAGEFIGALPRGYDTVIGERGVTLSGGQRQRLCIARAILADAPILILDEATSALDAESEALVQKALENLMVGRTTFIIAHRLATVTHANRIVVIEHGGISAIGTHQQLLETSDVYRRLTRLQFRDPSAPETWHDDAPTGDPEAGPAA